MHFCKAAFGLIIFCFRLWCFMGSLLRRTFVGVECVAAGTCIHLPVCEDTNRKRDKEINLFRSVRTPTDRGACAMGCGGGWEESKSLQWHRMLSSMAMPQSCANITFVFYILSLTALSLPSFFAIRYFITWLFNLV